MKLGIAIVAIIVITGALQFIAPWWILVPVVGIITYLLELKPWQGLVAGLLGIFILWAAYAMTLNNANEGIMAAQMGKLLGGLSPMLMILVSSLIGGIVGALAGLTGSYGRGLVKND